MTRAELDQVWYTVTFAIESEFLQRGWLPPGRRDDLTEAPTLSELAAVIHDARFGPDYPPHIVNSFDREGMTGQEYCYRLARAVMTHFRVAARSMSSQERQSGA